MVDFRNTKRVETTSPEIKVDAGLPLGRYVVQLTVIDENGNKSKPASANLYIARRLISRFVIFRDSKGEFRFRLKARNGEIILASEGYKRKSSCINGIESVKRHAPDDNRYQRKKARGGKFMFNLKARNNRVIGTSEIYNSVAARDKGVESVKNNAPDAKIDAAQS